MQTVGVSDFRQMLADVGNRIRYAGERIIVERNHKPLFAVVPCDDVEFLQALEDVIDLEAVRKALKRNDFVAWEKAKKELGL
jgi:antitoxin (DNA-binding transcriptional repressor) of toxin-antitoxin stability system